MQLKLIEASASSLPSVQLVSLEHCLDLYRAQTCRTATALAGHALAINNPTAI